MFGQVYTLKMASGVPPAPAVQTDTHTRALDTPSISEERLPILPAHAFPSPTPDCSGHQLTPQTVVPPLHPDLVRAAQPARTNALHSSHDHVEARRLHTASAQEHRDSVRLRAPPPARSNAPRGRHDQPVFCTPRSPKDTAIAYAPLCTPAPTPHAATMMKSKHLVDMPDKDSAIAYAPLNQPAPTPRAAASPRSGPQTGHGRQS